MLYWVLAFLAIDILIRLGAWIQDRRRLRWEQYDAAQKIRDLEQEIEEWKGAYQDLLKQKTGTGERVYYRDGNKGPKGRPKLEINK